MSSKKTRFCPSPTGLLHLGNLRIAFLNFLIAIESKGAFVLRIEDTDKERSQEKFSEFICNDLAWMELDWKEGPKVGGPHNPYFQSEREKIYESYFEELLTRDLIYPCFTSEQELKIIRKNQLAAGKPPRYPGIWAKATKEEVQSELDKGSKPVYRFRMPENTKISFIDLNKGEQSFDSNDLDDFIVRKEDGSPTFMFANAIDDALMEINLVLRGDDHLSNTPRQIALLESLGLSLPEFAHISLFLGNDGSPLSKRNGSLSVQDLKKKGYFPLAVTNYLTRVGHSIGNNEVKSLKDLASKLDLKKISKSPSHFDLNQLNFWQKKVLDTQSVEKLCQWLSPHLEGLLPKDVEIEVFVRIARENILFPEEAVILAQNILDKDFTLNDTSKKTLALIGKEFFSLAKKSIEDHWPNWSNAMKALSKDSGKKGKDLFHPIRLSLTGEEFGPELDQLCKLLGKDRIIDRLEKARKL